MSFDTLPDELLRKVFSPNASLSLKDRISGKLVSRRLYSVLGAPGVIRPEVEEFSVEVRVKADRATPIGKLNLNHKNQRHRRRIVVTASRKSKKRVIVEEECVEGPSGIIEPPHIVNTELRKVHLSDRLCVDGAILNEQFHSILMQKWNNMSDVKSLCFTLCRINWTPELFSQLLNRTSAEEIVLDFCILDPRMLNDKVLCSLPKLRSLQVQPRSLVYYPQITDQTVRYWIAVRPNRVLLPNIVTNITLAAIEDLLMSLPFDSSAFYFDLGRITPSAENDTVLVRIITTIANQVGSSDDFGAKRFFIRRGPHTVVFNLINRIQLTQ